MVTNRGRAGSIWSGMTIVTATEKALEALAALLLFLLMMITVVDVIGRYFFNKPLPGSVEISSIVLALLVFAALPLVSRRREHITVDLLTLAPGSTLSRISRGLAIFFTSTCSAWIAAQVWLLANDLAAHGDRSLFLGIPNAPVAYFIAAASVISAAFTLLRPPVEFVSESNDGADLVVDEVSHENDVLGRERG